MRAPRILICAVLALGSCSIALASPSGVVISGFQVRGPAGGNDEYVEIRNTSAGNADISGWKLQGCASSGGNASNRVTVGSGIVLTPGQYYLFANTASAGYSGSVAPDATYGTGFTDFGSNQSGIQLVDALGTKQDGVGSPTSPCAEGGGIASTPTSNTVPTAYARKLNGAQDTDVNAADFSGPQASNPHDSGGITVTCTNDGVHIFTIQGRAHVSPLNNQVVCNVPGIVTQVVSNGFFMQDGNGDGDDTTSDGIFVFTSGAPTVTAGQQVKVKGTVSEFRPGSSFGATDCPSSSGACNLSVTEITGPTVTVATGLFLPPHDVITPVVIGTGGRIPPKERIDDDTSGSVEVASQTTYDPANDGIDFYESLEGMLVQVNGARVVGPTNSFGEIWLVGDMGTNASGVNARGGVTLIDHGSYVDFNPERIMIDTSELTSAYPQANVGDTIVAPVVGAMSYDFGNFRVFPNTLPTFAKTGPARTASTVTATADHLRIASYNVENLDANDADVCDGGPDMDVANGRFTREAQQIVSALGSPDILGIEELQDNSGCTDDGTVISTTTLDTLIAAIVAAGGPQYQYVLVNPVNDADGGVPGGNIRQGILYNPARVTFVPGTDTTSNPTTTATALALDASGSLQLTLSPGRIDPNNAAWTTSRKPLVATFDFRGKRVLLIVNHFNSKGGDEPLFGRFQPPVLTSEPQRIQQAQVEHDFIAQALSLKGDALVVSLGDFNDFDFSAPMRTLTGAASGTPILTDLATALLPPEERYSYVFEGNSQELDHIYVTSPLVPHAEFQPIHVNAEYSDQVSDHDPMIASLVMPDTTPPTSSAMVAPAPNAQGWNNTPVTVTFSASDDTYGSGVAGIHYTLSGAQTGSGTVPPGGSVTITAEGTTTVAYYASDNAGNNESAHTLTVRIDETAPVITAPASLAVDATAPTGATVTFTATATDNSGATPSVTCTPASGSTFAIGDTKVTCSATDAAGNTASTSFNVHVRGVAEQTTQLVADIAALVNVKLPPGILNALTNTLQASLNSHNANAFCTQLTNFTRDVSKLSGNGLSAAQVNALVAEANRIRAAEGCK
jgi:predicted extracellular nuclease